MSAPDFLVLEGKGNASVIVAEGVKAGQSLSGWLMETDETLTVTVIEDIPLGHKVALITALTGAWRWSNFADHRSGSPIGRVLFQSDRNTFERDSRPARHPASRCEADRDSRQGTY